MSVGLTSEIVPGNAFALSQPVAGNYHCLECRTDFVGMPTLSTAPNHQGWMTPPQCPRCASWNVRPIEGGWRSPKALGVVAGILMIVLVAGGFGAVKLRKARAARRVAAAHAALLQKAENGSPAAEYAYAMSELNAVDPQATDAQANRARAAAWVWMERAAEDGNVEAQGNLGRALLEGRGISKDYARAAHWLQLAARANHGPAQLDLGRMLLDGLGGQTDIPTAYVWLSLAASQGVSEAVLLRRTAESQLSPEQLEIARTEVRRLGPFGSLNEDGSAPPFDGIGASKNP